MKALVHGADRCNLYETQRAAGDSTAIATISRTDVTTLSARGVCIDTVTDISDLKNMENDITFERWELFLLKRFGTAKILVGRRDSRSILDFSDACFRLLIDVGMDSVLRKTDVEIKDEEQPQECERFIARVVACFSISLWMHWLRRQFVKTWRSLRYYSTGKPYVGGHGETLVDAFARTIFTDTIMNCRFGTGAEYHGFWTGRAPTREASISSRDDRRSYRQDLISQLQEGSAQRRMMITEKGYIGLVPKHAQAGDLVCVLRGCSVPVLLRKEDDYHVFVGESYVHCLMDGEAMQQVARGTLQEEDFLLL